MWEHFHHQADIGIRGWGESVEKAFEEGAAAMMAVICEPSTIAQEREVQIRCEGQDVELLFVDWLNAIVYEMAARNMLFGRFEVSIRDGQLYGKAWGEKADPDKHQTAVEVKAATYSQLSVKLNENNKWCAQCVVDV